MNKRARMTDLADELLSHDERSEPPEEPKTRKLLFRKPAKRPQLAEAIEVSRPYGGRGDFEKVTVTLPSDVRDLLNQESLRRKRMRSSEWPITAIVRDALATYLNKRAE